MKSIRVQRLVELFFSYVLSPCLLHPFIAEVIALTTGDSANTVMAFNYRTGTYVHFQLIISLDLNLPSVCCSGVLGGDVD